MTDTDYSRQYALDAAIRTLADTEELSTDEVATHVVECAEAFHAFLQGPTAEAVIPAAGEPEPVAKVAVSLDLRDDLDISPEDAQSLTNAIGAAVDGVLKDFFGR